MSRTSLAESARGAVNAPRFPAFTRPTRLLWPVCLGLLWAALSAAAAACGGGGGAVEGVDGGADTGRYLRILNPSGEEIGLGYNSEVALLLSFETASGSPLREQTLQFALRASRPGESTAGATLAAPSARTDALGRAQVRLYVGARDTRFRVTVDAEGAATVQFFVSVSEGGFTRLTVTPTHEGWRDAEALSPIELRLYASALLSCQSLDVDAPPVSAYPALSAERFDEPLVFRNVSTHQPHTLVAWAHAGSDTPVALGCLPLDGAQLPPSDVRAGMVVRDRALRWPESTALRSEFDLAPVAAQLAAAGATRAWEVLACPAGPGQLLLDCTLDELVADGARDCVVTGSSALLAAIEAQRGAADAQGCRPSALAGGDESLDARLQRALGGRFPTGAALDELASARAAVLDSLELRSSLSALGGDSLWHRLEQARLPVGEEVYALDIGASARTVVEVAVDASADGDRVTLGEHAYTLRLAAIAADAFAALGLAPSSLAAGPRELGAALVAAVRDDASATSGCDALSRLVCASAEAAASCARSACESAADSADAALAAWLDALDAGADDVDFFLDGGLRVADDDADLVIDEVRDDGNLRARLRLAGELALELPGQLAPADALAPAPADAL
ncbi:hypothetical protein [Haliangium ochraceum]|uniref:Uncharacterized protein n=1 Tax=Haliangium ochraceum (strain DSM 14365 / JCM 11303 / SMP-2) TaxID=502025 RepID=D0LJI7_HALO1|nr:hypothetical protein [Haliangium ochraceum]ACY16561.1 hypothetical protein Hoch_4062 [Haliangium ochraceum DSM 14365]